MKNAELHYNDDIVTKIMSADTVAIYGAGTMGRAALKCLSEAPYNLSVKCFIVKSLNDNPDEIDGIPVLEIGQASEYKDSTVIIALNCKFIPEVVNDLTAAGFTDLVPVSFDGDEWTAIRGNWFEVNNILPADICYLSDLATENSESIIRSDELSERFHIYVVHSIYDRELSETLTDKPYEISIQVGAALTDRVMYEVRDSLGDDNISAKNRQYCELTGIYWAWKNDKSDYVGFSHYRRKFMLSEGQLSAIVRDNIDVVVTEPIVNFATVRGQYDKDHIVRDWDLFINVISEMAPEYLDAAKQVQNGIYYFAYNMYIMKHEIFDKYCSFIFPILEKCEKLIGSKEDVYQNRYVGFLAERLLSIFLTRNSEYKVAIADKHFIE